MKKLKPRVYKNASELVFQAVFGADNRFACHAICNTFNNPIKAKQYVETFEQYFKPNEDEIYTYGILTPLSMFGWFGNGMLEHQQLARQLALLFMAEIAKDEK